MKSYDAVTEAGLKESETKVYLAVLELGEATVQEVAYQSGLQRPNCYAVLESLRKIGLVSLGAGDRGRRYIAEDPRRLKKLLTERLDHLDEALPLLQANYSRSPSRPRVRYYEGKDSIYRLYEDILNSGRYDAVYSPEFIQKEVGDYVEYFGKIVAERKIKMREIITGQVVPDHYGKIFHEPLQQVRYLSPQESSRTEFIIYENKLALLAYRPSVHALVVEGSDIIQTMRLMFEELWIVADNKLSKS